MDGDSLVQIAQIVSAAISKETQALGTSLRQEIGEKAETLAASLRQEFGEKTESRAGSLRQELGERLNEKFEEAERHSRVLFEEMGRRLDLIVEGHQALHQHIEKLETKMEHEFLEVRALIQLSYRQLQERVETLEQRVQFIEKRLGLSA
jgi:polyhydroxyalkanoate synthesis regulator phasin